MRLFRNYIDDVDYGLKLEDNTSVPSIQTIIDKYYICGDRKYKVIRKWKKSKPNGKWYRFQSNKFYL